MTVLNSSTAIFREPTPEEKELAQLRAALAEHRKRLAAQEQALSDLRGHLFSFEGRYIRQVGLLYKRLDEWEQKIAELHAKQGEGVEFSFDEIEGGDDCSVKQPSLLLPDLKALFRELAKRIHPDFAVDHFDEERRTRLMAQANDAFRREDHHALQRMLNGFEASEEESRSQTIQAEIRTATLQIDLIKQDIEAAKAETEALSGSELAKLEAQAIEAALKGRDLLAEMAARVKGRIGIAMRQYELDLDRIKRPSVGLSVESLVTAETHPIPSSKPHRRA